MLALPARQHFGFVVRDAENSIFCQNNFVLFKIMAAA
jgi:hypothetical protein